MLLKRVYSCLFLYRVPISHLLSSLPNCLRKIILKHRNTNFRTTSTWIYLLNILFISWSWSHVLIYWLIYLFIQNKCCSKKKQQTFDFEFKAPHFKLPFLSVGNIFLMISLLDIIFLWYSPCIFPSDTFTAIYNISKTYHKIK